MAAAGDLLTPARLEIVSPELVLVDPRLATAARALLFHPGDTFARVGQMSRMSRAQASGPASNAAQASSVDEEIGAALRRITELSEVEPPRRRRRRLISLVAALAATSALAMLVIDLQLGLYQWPF